IYGMRLVGGIAAGLSNITAPRFVILNALSSAVWAVLFGTIGYVFGLGAEHFIGQALMHHERLLIGLGIGLTVAVVAWLVARHIARRERAREG
ncbi:DUF1109 family protein, partial [Mesorhizobium sp. M7A.F.Ca.CA.002.04.1.1]